MAEDDKEETVDPKTVKGVNTASDNGKITTPEFRPELAYREPRTREEAWQTGLGKAAFEYKSGTNIAGSNLLVHGNVNQLFTPIDLAKGIPDKFEREKFINDNGTRMVQLLDPNKFGIRFDRDLQDYAAFREKNYNTQVKKFLDELDENQGFIASAGNTLAKLVGKTALNVGGLVPLTYGLAKGLFTWDAQNVFNNGVFDAWETMDQGLDKHLAVYGGSDYAYNANGQPKNFFSRFITHPMKSLNADVAPAVSFVAGAVLTEMAAGAITAATFGGGSAILAGNTARLAAQASNLFGNTLIGAAKLTNSFSKGYKVIRGLDQLSDFNNMRKIANLTKTYRAGIGTATSMVRSAGYESSLIARDTYDQTLEQAKKNYLRTQNFTDEEIFKILQNPEMEESVISPSKMALIKKGAEDASELAWFTNIPLVGFSNMIQFSKAFSSGYRVNQAISRLNPLRMTGTVAKGGKVVARADAMGKFGRALGYGTTALKSGVVEGFEEYAQGVIQEGYSNYWSAQFSDEAIKNSTTFLKSMTTAARNYGGSVEGFDSMSIGFLMGMLGLKLPVKYDAQTGKLTRGWESYGGVRSEIKEVKKEVEKARATAKNINDNPVNPVLKNNFENMAKNFTIQSEMDEALEKGDIFNYKNKEYEQFHSFVSTRVKNQIGETVTQELDALEQLPLETFNQQFGIQGVLEFTEETRKTALDKARLNTENIIKAHNEVDTAFNDSKVFVDFWRKNFKGMQDPLNLAEPLKDQMTFLYGATLNLENREDELEGVVNKLSKGNVSPKVLNKLIAQIAGVSAKDSLEFATTAKELYQAELNNWKENDPTSYNLNRKQIEPLLQDLILIKERKAKISKMYDVLFTNKGAKQFLDIYTELYENSKIAMAQNAEEDTKKAAAAAKSSDTLNKVAADEKSLTGATSIVDEKAAAELAATDQELASIIADLDPKAKDATVVDTDTLIQTLQSKPALFREIIAKLERENKAIPGLSNIDQLAEVLANDPNAAGKISNALTELLKTFNEDKTEPAPALDFADPTDANQPAPLDEDAEFDPNFYASATREIEENSIFETSNVGNNSIIPLLYDKKIKDGQLVRNPKTGRWEVWTGYNGEKSDQPSDNDLINSPDFLSNKELYENTIEATFKVEETEPYRDPKTGKMVEITDENIKINVYQGDTFIGQLPAFKKGMPAHFLALRKAIVEQESGIAIEEEVTPAIDSIEAKKAERIKRYSNRPANRMQKYNPDGENTDLTQDQIDEIEQYIESAKENGWNTDRVFRLLNKLGYTYAMGNSAEAFKNYLTDRLSGETNIKVTSEFNINAQIDAELAATEQQPTSTIKKKRVRLKNAINDFDVEAQALLNNPNPTIEEYEAVVNGYEFDLSADISDTLRADIESKLADIKNTFEISKPASRREAIDANFNMIIKQLAKAKVNIFFNEETNSNKKC